MEYTPRHRDIERVLTKLENETRAVLRRLIFPDRLPALVLYKWPTRRADHARVRRGRRARLALHFIEQTRAVLYEQDPSAGIWFALNAAILAGDLLTSAARAQLVARAGGQARAAERREHAAKLLREVNALKARHARLSDTRLSDRAAVRLLLAQSGAPSDTPAVDNALRRLTRARRNKP